MDRGKLAYDYFLSGYNCTQSVVLAYKDFFENVDLDFLLRSVSSFGGGMGRLREVCGTVTGAFFVLGTIYGYDKANDNEKKKNLYIKVQEFAHRFEKENSSIVCRELLGLKGRSKPDPEERTKGYYLRRPCPMYASSSASILETYLIEEGILDSNGEKRR